MSQALNSGRRNRIRLIDGDELARLLRQPGNRPLGVD
jgi:hypothetical protein